MICVVMSVNEVEDGFIVLIFVVEFESGFGVFSRCEWIDDNDFFIVFNYCYI